MALKWLREELPVFCQIMARLAAVACVETILGLGLVLRLGQYGRPSLATAALLVFIIFQRLFYIYEFYRVAVWQRLFREWYLMESTDLDWTEQPEWVGGHLAVDAAWIMIAETDECRERVDRAWAWIHRPDRTPWLHVLVRHGHCRLQITARSVVDYASMKHRVSCTASYEMTTTSCKQWCQSMNQSIDQD